MTNPISAMFDEARETFAFVIFVIIIILVLGSIGVAFGMQEFTNQIISSITWGFYLY